MQRLLEHVHALTRGWWDPSRGLLTHPGGYLGEVRVGRAEVGLLAPTAWWAHGLLRRGDAGDHELAEEALRGVLDRWPDEPHPTVVDGAALALVLRDHDLPGPLVTEARAVLERALRAEEDRELDARHTSLAVHRAWLELEVGRWTADPALLEAGVARAQAVAADSATRGHLAEHVGPTVTGLTLTGLSLWAQRPPVPELAPLGRALRDEVWHDLLAVWHPGLRTLVPPFTHAHGMDLQAHVGATGLWLAWLVDGTHPLPELDGDRLDQGHHLPLAFLVDALAAATDDVRALAPLVRAQPARQGEWFDRVGERVWTGWTGGTMAVGAEWSPDDRQRATVAAAGVWRAPTGRNAWLWLRQATGAVDARVEHVGGRVRLVHATHSSPVRLLVGGEPPARVTATRVVHGGRNWDLQGVGEVVPEETEFPDVTASWRLVPGRDGIVLSTEAD